MHNYNNTYLHNYVCTGVCMYVYMYVRMYVYLHYNQIHVYVATYTVYVLTKCMPLDNNLFPVSLDYFCSNEYYTTRINYAHRAWHDIQHTNKYTYSSRIVNNPNRMVI